MYEFMLITKALADQSRIRALFALKNRELCVCQIVALLELAPSTVSKHLSILKNARLVECVKRGRWNFYRIIGEDGPDAAKQAVSFLFKSLGRCPEILEDQKRLRDILEILPEDLCHTSK